MAAAAKFAEKKQVSRKHAMSPLRKEIRARKIGIGQKAYSVDL
jgi:hypothetical protein